MGSFRDTSCAFKLDDGFGERRTGYHACRAEVIADPARAALEAYISYIDN